MNEMDNDFLDLLLDPSLDSSNDSWLFGESDDENHYVFKPGKVSYGKKLRLYVCVCVCVHVYAH